MPLRRHSREYNRSIRNKDKRKYNHLRDDKQFHIEQAQPELFESHDSYNDAYDEFYGMIGRDIRAIHAERHAAWRREMDEEIERMAPRAKKWTKNCTRGCGFWSGGEWCQFCENRCKQEDIYYPFRTEPRCRSVWSSAITNNSDQRIAGAHDTFVWRMLYYAWVCATGVVMQRAESRTFEYDAIHHLFGLLGDITTVRFNCWGGEMYVAIQGDVTNLGSMALGRLMDLWKAPTAIWQEAP